MANKISDDANKTVVGTEKVAAALDGTNYGILISSIATYVLSLVVLPSHISGLTLSAAGSTATFGIAAGVAADSTNASMMQLESAFTKTTSAWAAGSGNGAIDTGSVANSTWYHVYLIRNLSTGVVDVTFSLSASSPNLPSGYTKFRRIGSMKTNGSAQWVKFTQTGDSFIWADYVADVNGIATTTSRVLTTLSVPTGVVVRAKMRAAMSASSSCGTLICSPQETDASISAANENILAAASGFDGGLVEALTNTSAQVAVRSSATVGTLYIGTYGWDDTRGRHL